MKSIIDKFDIVYCRSESHKKNIDNYFNISCRVKNFNLEEIYNDAYVCS